MSGALVAALFAAGSALTAPEATQFVGNWTCERPASGMVFTWAVSDRLTSPWLIGEAAMEGEPVAVDIWAVDAEGRLGLRRQFGPNGKIVEVEPVEGDGTSFTLEGVFDPGGAAIAMAESIRFINNDRFEAQWRYFDKETDAWKVDSDETCTKE